MDAANLGFGALIVGQVVAKEFRMDWTLWGLGLWVGFLLGGSLLVYWQERLTEGRERKDE